MEVSPRQTIKEVKSITIGALLDSGEEVTLQFDIKAGRPVYDKTSLSFLDDINDRTLTLKFNFAAFDMRIIYH